MLYPSKASIVDGISGEVNATILSVPVHPSMKQFDVADDPTATCEQLQRESSSCTTQPSVFETFNIMFVGQSGLGKSTCQANIFRHLDPTWQHQAMRDIETRREQAMQICERLERLGDDESFFVNQKSDDERAAELFRERKEETAVLNTAIKALHEAQAEYGRQEQEMEALERSIEDVEAKQKALRNVSKYDDSKALQARLEALRATRQQKMMRWSMTPVEAGAPEQTLEVQVKEVRGMPLWRNSEQRLDVKLIDTPGFSDVVVGTEGSFKAVLDEVEARLQRHAAECAHNVRNCKDRSGLVHVCVFFLGPHRMMEDDLRMMERLHTVCPLIPVIAKSDTMTVEESVDYKDVVRRTMRMRNISTAELDGRAWRAIETRHAEEHGFKPHYRLPLAVMASHAADEHGEAQRGYPWGAARPDHPPHSELPALREMLLQEGQWRLLRDQALDRADAEMARRKGGAWQEEQRKKQADAEKAVREQAALRSCPADLLTATAGREEAKTRVRKLEETKSRLESRLESIGADNRAYAAKLENIGADNRAYAAKLEKLRKYCDRLWSTPPICE